MYKFYYVCEKVYDSGRRFVTYGSCCRDKLPKNEARSNIGYIEYYSYFYTQEAMQNYIRDNKVA